jgi:hypothetical protein
MMELLTMLALLKEGIQIFDWFLFGIFGITLARYYWIKGTDISNINRRMNICRR